MTTFLRGHGQKWLMLAAPHVTAQYSGICRPSRREA